jgi:ferrous iron transport protein A
MTQKPLSRLRKGEIARIHSFLDEAIALKLLEMGCLPQAPISLLRTAPLGDPLCVVVGDYVLALRRRDADTVLVELMA